MKAATGILIAAMAMAVWTLDTASAYETGSAAGHTGHAAVGLNIPAAEKVKEGHKIRVGMKGDRKPIVEADPAVRSVIESGAPKFTQDVFFDEETHVSLAYSLYVPEGYDSHQAYPLLMYIPDASGASKSAEELVSQYYGADIWVTEEEQKKHPAFVVVPAFSEIVVDDDWNTSEEIEAAVHLLAHLTQSYNIDERRLYATGQSMGCMTSLYINSKHPDLFAASLFVAGQWDISVLKPLEQAKFFYIAAGGDPGAVGGQKAVRAMFDADQVPYSYGSWSAQDDMSTQNKKTEALIAQGHAANMICFEPGSVLQGRTGMEHAASFVYGYKIPAVRDWLFAQSK